MIRWNRSEEGFVESKDGRWWICPLFIGRTTPQGYELWDNSRPQGEKRVSGLLNTQADAKRAAERKLQKELEERS